MIDCVSSKVALLLKAKGFDEPCLCFYCKMYDSVICTLKTNTLYKTVTYLVLEEGDYLVPSLYQVQKWLREKYNIHITIGNSASGYWWEASKANNGTFIAGYNYFGPNDGGKWNTYEEALDAALFDIINTIKL